MDPSARSRPSSGTAPDGRAGTKLGRAVGAAASPAAFLRDCFSVGLRERASDCSLSSAGAVSVAWLGWSKWVLVAVFVPAFAGGPSCYSTRRSRRQLPGTPLRVWLPCSSKLSPEPMTSSDTVLETRTSPGPASAPIRAAMCTARPCTSPAFVAPRRCELRRASRCRSFKFAFDLLRTPDRPRGSVERRQEAVAERLHLLAAISPEPVTDDTVMSSQQVAPVAVAEFGGAVCRIDDVGEQDGRQDRVGIGGATLAGEELLDLVKHGVTVARNHAVVAAVELDEARAVDAGRQMPALLDRDQRVVSPVDHERRRLDRGQQVANVDPHRDMGETPRHGGARGIAFKPPQPTADTWVLSQRGGIQRGVASGAPARCDEPLELR